MCAHIKEKKTQRCKGTQVKRDIEIKLITKRFFSEWPKYLTWSQSPLYAAPWEKSMIRPETCVELLQEKL